MNVTACNGTFKDAPKKIEQPKEQSPSPMLAYTYTYTHTHNLSAVERLECRATVGVSETEAIHKMEK